MLFVIPRHGCEHQAVVVVAGLSICMHGLLCCAAIFCRSWHASWVPRLHVGRDWMRGMACFGPRLLVRCCRFFVFFCYCCVLCCIIPGEGGGSFLGWYFFVVVVAVEPNGCLPVIGSDSVELRGLPRGFHGTDFKCWQWRGATAVVLLLANVLYHAKTCWMDGLINCESNSTLVQIGFRLGSV